MCANFGVPLERFAYLPWPTVVQCVRDLEELEMRRSYATVQLTHVVANALGASVEFEELLPPFASLGDGGTRPYPRSQAQDMRLALQLGLMPQDCLDCLDWERIKASPK